MALDSKYQDNVILTKDAYQDLLTNIKNYPIIDIDYITEDEEDELHGDLIWPGYTEGMPCIKITYGNERETKGNIIFCEEEKKELRKIQREINRLNVILNNQTWLRDRWLEVWNQNQKVQQQKIDQAYKLANNLISFDTDKYNFLLQAYNLLSDFYDPSVIEDPNKRYSLIIPDENYFINHGTNGNVVFPDYFNFQYETFQQTEESQITITFRFLEVNSKLRIADNIQRIRDALYPEDSADEEIIRKRSLFNNFYDFINQYNNLVFLDGIQGINLNYNTNTGEGIPLSILQYLDFNTYNPSYNFNTTYNSFKTSIKDILEDINGKVRENLQYARSQIEFYNNIINWLNEGHEPSSPMEINGHNEQKSIGDYQKEIEEINQRIDQKVNESGHKIYGYKYVKVGSNITWDNYDTVEEKTDDTNNQASGTFRITINGHTYEVPIKGFGEIPSNQPIILATTNDDGIIVRAKNDSILNLITLDGNVNITGDTNITGNTNIAGDTNVGGNILPSEYLKVPDASTYDSNIHYFIQENGEYIPYNYNESTWNDDVSNGLYYIPSDIGADDKPFNCIYTSEIHIGDVIIGGNDNGSGADGDNASNKVLGENGWTDHLTGPLTIGSDGGLIITNTTDAKRYTDGTSGDPNAGNEVSNIDLLIGSIKTLGGIAAGKTIKGSKVHGAVFNDYAEYRHTDNIEPGRCVIETGDGSLILSTKRMQLGANIISDTFGFSIGETQYANTPIAVCGRVLAYTDGPKEMFKAGEAVCSGPNGTVSRMVREEIRNWPDAIVGYVSEIPTYDTWGSDNIKVNGRIWIKVK